MPASAARGDLDNVVLPRKHRKKPLAAIRENLRAAFERTDPNDAQRNCPPFGRASAATLIRDIREVLEPLIPWSLLSCRGFDGLILGHYFGCFAEYIVVSLRSMSGPCRLFRIATPVNRCRYFDGAWRNRLASAALRSCKSPSINREITSSFVRHGIEKGALRNSSISCSLVNLSLKSSPYMAMRGR